MPVVMTSEAFGKLPGETYSGPEEAWALAEGYASQAGYDADTAAVLVGTTNAVNIVTGGNLVIDVDHEEFTVALLAADTPAQAATKIDTALAGVADAAIVSSKLNVTSVATGSDANIRVVSGTGTVLANLGLAVDQSAAGGNGGVGVSNTGPTAVLPANDPTVATNRETNTHGYIADPAYDAGPLDPALDLADGNPSGYEPARLGIYPAYDFDPGGVENDPSVILSLSPVAGPRAGGTVVTIKGTGFEGATGVTFGGVSGTSFTVVDDRTIRVTTGAHAAGAVDVVVSDALGNDTEVGGFTYNAPAFAATNSVTPATGPAAGGTAVVITGTDFTSAITGVTFGGSAGTAFSIISPTEIHVTTPAHAAGAVNVVLVDAAGNITKTNGFTYA